MPTRQRKKISVSILIPFLVFVLFFSIMIWQKYRSSDDAPVVPAPQSTTGKRSISLFFTAEGTRLARETRDVDMCEDDNACLKSVLDELVNGPVGGFEKAIPEGSVVTSALIEGDLATVEFNSAFSESMLSGSSAEMLAVYSVVNTVATNFPQIQKVKIDVDGDKEAVLKHLELSDPLAPDYSLEQSLPPDSEKTKKGSNNNRKKERK